MKKEKVQRNEREDGRFEEPVVQNFFKTPCLGQYPLFKIPMPVVSWWHANFNRGFTGGCLNLQMQQYNPVPRAFYEAVEELHLLKTPFNLTFEDDFGRKTLLEVRITDLFSEEGAEWMIIDKGIRIRLDNIVAINGRPAQYMA